MSSTKCDRLALMDPGKQYALICRQRTVLNVPVEAPNIIKAAAENSVELVLDWISKGDDVNARDDEGYTALHYAACRDHSDVVRTLLLHRAAVRGTVPHSPLALAIFHDSSLAVDVLLSCGEDPTHVDHSIGTIFSAILYGAPKCTQVLLKHNGDVNYTGRSDRSTVLHLACALLHADYQKFRNDRDTMLAIIRTLASSDGIKLNQRDMLGVFALHLAAEVAPIEVVKCLVESGANPSVVDLLGNTPATYAETDSEVKDFLLSCEGKLIISLSNTLANKMNRVSNAGPVSLVGMKRSKDAWF